MCFSIHLFYITSIKNCGHTSEYIQGIKDFLQFAFTHSAKENTILCPCRKGVNSCWKEASDIYDEGRSVQCSGVALVAQTYSFAAGNNNSMVENKVYYGVLTEILELDYKHKGNIVLFKCEWVDNRVLNKWVKVDKLGIIDVNFRHLFNTGTKLSDEPFILASQAIQVYYVPDPADNGWSAVIQTNPRDFYDMAKVQTENSECENEYVDQCPDLGGSIYITTDPTDVPPFRSDIDGIFVNTNEKRKKSMASGGGNVNNTARNKYEQERAEKIKTNNIALQAVIEKSRELTNLTKGNLGSTSTHQQRKRKVISRRDVEVLLDLKYIDTKLFQN